MSTLADFAFLSLTELTAEIAAMQATFTPVVTPVLPLVAHPSERVATGNLSPATAGTSRDVPEISIPLGRAVAGNSLSEQIA